ncbi:MAG: hypothetical protein ACYCXR_04395 [Coriobacteriia bacterium]
MRRIGAFVPFIIAIAVTFFAFPVIGGWLGEILEGIARSSAGGGPITAGDAFPLLLALDAVVLVVTFAISYFGGVLLPSGLPHVAFGLFFPLTLAATQARFFELAGSVDGLADSFGGFNFAAVFVLVIVMAELGVALSRRRYERREGAESR